LLFASRAVGGEGLVVGVDITPVSVRLPSNVTFVACDALDGDASFFEAIGGPFDVVLSDMAPATTGSKFVDAHRSLELSQSALATACRVLVPGGAFVCKIFQGPDAKGFSDQAKSLFGRVAHIKPRTTRKASKEIYLIGLEKK
jgi:23S rRNA (uridine2552-2'-O)-methyltransferase